MLLSFLQQYWTALLLNACPTTYSKLPYRKTIARNHLSSSFCQQALPVFSSCANTSFLYLSSCANTIQTSLVKFHWLWETVEEIINKKKIFSDILKGFIHFQNNTWSKIFFCAFFLTQVQVKLIEVSSFTGTTIPKRDTHWLVFGILMFDQPLNFTICSSMLWEPSFETELLKILVIMVNKGSNFVTFVTFVIYCVVRKMEIS